MHMASKMYDRVEFDNSYKNKNYEEYKEFVRIAALLHDIGHGPFSHTYESVLSHINPDMSQIHEEIGMELIKNDGEINDHLGKTKHEIAHILEGTGRPNRKYPLLSSIVSGNLDADKLDYFARDSYHLGVKYGVVDTDRILHVLRKDRTGKHIGVHLKGNHVLNSYRMARYLIATQIYSHHTRLAADQMFIAASKIAFDDEHVLDRDDFTFGSKSFLQCHTNLDDSSFVHMIMSHDNANVSKLILANIQQRRLLKPCLTLPSKTLKDGTVKDQILDTKTILDDASTQIRKSLHLAPHELIVYKSDIPIKLFNKSDIMILDDEGKEPDTAPISPIQADLGILNYYVFGIAKKRSQIREKFVKMVPFSQ